jgi:hypothetical protein
MASMKLFIKKISTWWLQLTFSTALTTAVAQNTEFTYQGRVLDHGTTFTGTGQFEFSLVTSSNANSQATAAATINGGAVTGIGIVNGGSGYPSAPVVTIGVPGGSGVTATAIATVSDGVVTSVAINNGGSGYASVPAVTIGPPPPDLFYTTYWNSDGTGGSQPESAMDVGVTNGLFTVVLGDTNLANMAPIDMSLFAEPNLQLRIWFNDGVNGFAALTPAQNLTPTPYAIEAMNANGASNLLGLLPATQLSGTIANSSLPANPSFAGTVTAGSFSGSGTGLTSVSASTLSSASLSFLTNSALGQTYSSSQPDYSQWPDGWNSWFSAGAGISQSIVTNAMALMAANGLQACGLTTISMDGGDFTNRDTNGIPLMNAAQFPNGFPWLAKYLSTNGFRVGVYGVVSPGFGLSGDASDYYFYGAEAAGANYFLTNGVTYFKFDAPITPIYGTEDAWPDLYSFNGDEVQPFGVDDVYDLSYLTFVTDCRQSSRAVFFNASTRFDGLNYGANITTLLNSWRYTGMSFTNSLGQVFSGDIDGPQNEFLLWGWIGLAAQQTPPQGGWHYPDFDTLQSSTIAGFQRHMYAAAEFGSIFQVSSPSALDGTFQYHSWTNELGSALIHQIRARGTIPYLAYVTNGCYVYEKDNLQGGKDVLVENENYAALPGGNGSADENNTLYQRWTELVCTNCYVYGSSNCYFSFWATNAVLDFGRLGLSGANCQVTTLCPLGNSTAQATGSLPVFLYAAGANLYTINPVNTFPTPAGPTVNIMALPWFNFWTTNSPGNPLNELEPYVTTGNITGTSAPSMTLGGAVYYPINGAGSFQCLAGVSSTGNSSIGSRQWFYVDGSLVATTAVWTANGQSTNIFFNLSPTDQMLEIVSSNLATFQAIQFNYTNSGNYNGTFAGNGSGLVGVASATNAAYLTGTNPADGNDWNLDTNGDFYTSGDLSARSVSGSFTGNAGGLTNLNASQLTSGTVPLARLTGITSNQLDAATWQLATNLNGGFAALASNVVPGISITNASITNSFFAGNGGGLTNLNAAELSSRGLGNFFVGSAGNSTTSGANNTAMGLNSLAGNTTGSGNTAYGSGALSANTGGTNNIALGFNAGDNISTSSSDIDIGSPGIAGDNRTTRIGVQGVQTNAFIAGVSGATAASGVEVYVNANGQLGTLTSSARFKQDIQKMGDTSDVLLALQPVTFKYKAGIDPDGTPQFGLIAEQVAQVDPDLVARDDQHRIYTVRYQAVNAMLLNEFLKQHQTIEEQNAEIRQQSTEINDLKARLDKVEQFITPKKTGPQN